MSWNLDTPDKRIATVVAGALSSLLGFIIVGGGIKVHQSTYESEIDFWGKTLGISIENIIWVVRKGVKALEITLSAKGGEMRAQDLDCVPS